MPGMILKMEKYSKDVIVVIQIVTVTIVFVIEWIRNVTHLNVGAKNALMKELNQSQIR